MSTDRFGRRQKRLRAITIAVALAATIALAAGL